MLGTLGMLGKCRMLGILGILVMLGTLGMVGMLGTLGMLRRRFPAAELIRGPHRVRAASPQHPPQTPAGIQPDGLARPQHPALLRPPPAPRAARGPPHALRTLRPRLGEQR